MSLGKSLHDSQWVETALKNFKSVFLEKPLSLPANDFRDLLKIAEEANVLVHQANSLLPYRIWDILKENEVSPTHIEIRRSFQPGMKVVRFKEILLEDIEFTLTLLKGTPVKIWVNGSRSEEVLHGFFTAHIESDNGETTHLNYNFLQPEEKVVAELYQSDKFYQIDYFHSGITTYTLGKSKRNLPGKAMVLQDNITLFPGDSNDFKSEINRFLRELEGMEKPKISLEECFTAISTVTRICEKIPDHSKLRVQ